LLEQIRGIIDNHCLFHHRLADKKPCQQGSFAIRADSVTTDSSVGERIPRTSIINSPQEAFAANHNRTHQQPDDQPDQQITPD
jgi:hypothetical protein